MPVRLVSRMLDQSASLISTAGRFSVIPAALTRMSTLPNAARMASCKAWRDARSPTSLAARNERRSRASISAAAFSTSGNRREEGTTSAPASASPRAMAWPRPVTPPMTTATLPVKSNRGGVTKMILRPAAELIKAGQPTVEQRTPALAWCPKSSMQGPASQNAGPSTPLGPSGPNVAQDDRSIYIAHFRDAALGQGSPLAVMLVEM